MKATKVTCEEMETTDKYQIDLTVDFDNGVQIGVRGASDIANKQHSMQDAIHDLVRRTIAETVREIEKNSKQVNY